MKDEPSTLMAMIDACIEAWLVAKNTLASDNALFVWADLEARLAKLEAEQAGFEEEPSSPNDEPLPE